jgi:hypothetical protein
MKAAITYESILATLMSFMSTSSISYGELFGNMVDLRTLGKGSLPFAKRTDKRVLAGYHFSPTAFYQRQTPS